MFSDYDKTSPSIAAVSAPSVACSKIKPVFGGGANLGFKDEGWRNRKFGGVTSEVQEQPR